LYDFPHSVHTFGAQIFFLLAPFPDVATVNLSSFSSTTSSAKSPQLSSLLLSALWEFLTLIGSVALFSLVFMGYKLTV
jgi:hypothetical protein